MRARGVARREGGHGTVVVAVAVVLTAGGEAGESDRLRCGRVQKRKLVKGSACRGGEGRIGRGWGDVRRGGKRRMCVCVRLEEHAGSGGRGGGAHEVGGAECTNVRRRRGEGRGVGEG